MKLILGKFIRGLLFLNTPIRGGSWPGKEGVVYANSGFYNRIIKQVLSGLNSSLEMVKMSALEGESAQPLIQEKMQQTMGGMFRVPVNIDGILESYNSSVAPAVDETDEIDR